MGFLSSIATHDILHPPRMAGPVRMSPMAMRGAAMGDVAGLPQEGGFSGFLDRMTSNPLSQIGMALMAGGGGPLANSMAMLMQQGAYRNLARQQMAMMYQPRVEHIGNQIGLLNPMTGEFNPTYTEPANDEVSQLIRHAGIDPESPEGQKAYQTILQNREDPEVQIPLPNGAGTYVGPRSGFETTVQGMAAPPTAPGALAPSSVPGGSLNAAVAQVESGGRDFNKNGLPLTSSAGAKYAMQVTPATAHNPGYGVTPAADDSAAEYDRVGRDYLAALQKHYGGNLSQALAAYNAGPGTVDRALSSGSPLPSQGYVSNVMGRLGNGQSDIIAQAQQAIAAGADPEKVRARAAQMGVTLP